ncbi:MAG: branched-chain amino acid ABC transporter permease [Spirochaetes bacterium RBG_16_49_21]|nr:MAG: branched-chain amino acid ABC transporter permease [Spirochaetes bacterium RBG_16_49_21]
MAQLELFLQTLISGFLLGGLYALIALGMALIMGVMRIINLAHGDIMMMAMYIAFWLFTLFGIDPYVSVFIAAPALFLFGMGVQKYLLTPVMKVESILPHNQVILTVGLAMVLSNLATVLFTGNYRSTPVNYASNAWYLTDIWKGSPIELSLSMPWTLSFVIAIVITIALWLFLSKTDIGKSIRATSQDPDAALILGVNVNRMRMLTFGIGCALVACAGCLFIPIYYLYPSLGKQFTNVGFVITVIGGMGSTNGAVIGGLILGIFESMTATYIGMGWAPVGRFAIFVAALVFLPGGVASIIRRRKLGK